MKNLIASVMASMVLLCVSSAQAWCEPDYCYASSAPCAPCVDREGFYIGGYGGVNFLSTDIKFRHEDGSSSRLKFNTGYVGAASLGYRFSSNIRLEFEYSYRSNKNSKHFEHDKVELEDNEVELEDNEVELEHCRRNRLQGQFWSNSYLVNIYYDLPWCNDWFLTPYVGAGIGYAAQHTKAKVNLDEFFSSSSAKKNGFAWQVIVGVAYPIGDSLDMFVDYRFNEGKADHVYNQNVGAGLRFYF